jgi:hypothetical protein
VIASFSGPGSLIKSLGALLPFVSMAIVGSFANYAKARWSLLAAVCMVSVYSAYQGYSKNLESTLHYNAIYSEYGTLRSIVLNDANRRGLHPEDVAILARDTWDVYEGTGLKTIMVPNNDIDTIVYVAHHYAAHYLLLPAKRPQLDKIYSGVTPDARIRFLAAIPDSDLRVYWMEFGP